MPRGGEILQHYENHLVSAVETRYVGSHLDYCGEHTRQILCVTAREGQQPSNLLLEKFHRLFLMIRSAIQSHLMLSTR